MTGIGLLNEKSLHASLKRWYARPEDRMEEKVDGFVIDIVRDKLLIEIQTGTFSAIKVKLTKLCRDHPVRLVYPIAREKWIIKAAEAQGEPVRRRRSPKRGRLEDIFGQLVSFPHLLAHPNFSVEVLMIQEEEVRRRADRRRWRRKGWTTEERRMLAVVDRHLFASPLDLQNLLPEGMAEPFTTLDLCRVLGIRRPLAQKMVYCLHKTDMIWRVGKQGRANLFASGPQIG